MVDVTYPCYWQKQDNKGQWYWLYYAANGKVIARSSESYVSRGDCEYAIQLLKKSSESKVFYDEPEA